MNRMNPCGSITFLVLTWVLMPPGLEPPVWSGADEILPGTQPLTWDGDLSVKMMDGAHAFVERKIAETRTTRPLFWNRDFASPDAYEKSIAPNREELKRILGVVDPRVPAVMEYFGDDDHPARAAETSRYCVMQVRWPVWDGVSGEGLLMQPKSTPAGYVVALPDADQTPEQLAGLAPGLPPEEQFARRFAENGFAVIVPVLISREAQETRPGFPSFEESRREWIYRQAFQMGRHVIGYEIQKVLAAVDWIISTAEEGAKIGVAGYGEGGLTAFYAAAVDPRIDAAWVSGYFDDRQNVWSEPIYRNVWSLLRVFGDAEIATLIAPRGLIIEYSRVPEVTNQKGGLTTPPFQRVSSEFARIDQLLKPGFQIRRLFAGPENSPAPVGSPDSLHAFAELLGVTHPLALSEESPLDLRNRFDPSSRQKRQVQELEDYTQKLVRISDEVREQFFLHQAMPEFAKRKWNTDRDHETYPPEPFIEKARWYREYFAEELIGRFDEPMLPPHPRSRIIMESEKWTGYEVVLDVYPELFAWGYLLIPNDIRPGEKRPVVVCQHGRQGLPITTIEPSQTGYYGMGTELANRGFVIFAPHNLYRGEDRYRWLDRKANGIKASLFSFIVSQHDQITRWLAEQPFVDSQRIAFYGKSYGGETAMRVPAILENYCLSICSGDFNQWTRKVASTQFDFSFMYTIEWEMPYFNLGNTFDYAEMAYLIFPRPFMVERGHHDAVGRDPWVAYEYAKVRWLYTQLRRPERTEIEFFNGGHAIHGQGTFEFLHKFLNWKKPES